MTIDIVTTRMTIDGVAIPPGVDTPQDLEAVRKMLA